MQATNVRKKDRFKSNKCPICMSDTAYELYPANIDLKKLVFTYEFSPESQKTFRVVRCRSCSHVFCSPLPRNIYKNYENVVDKQYLRHYRTRELSAQSVLGIVKRYVSSGKLLDIGCATGDFLGVAKNIGYLAEGLELSRWSAKIARKKGVTIYRNRLKTLAGKFPARYSIITMWGVIEHFENPFGEMTYINRLLKPGGILAIWTGNVDGIMSRMLGRRWWYWQGQHIQYFTSDSLDNLASSTDFDHIATYSYPIAATYEQVANSLNRYKFRKYLIPLIRLLFLIKPIWYLRLPGEMLWLGRKAFKK
jgi:2-polyprenyl-3-methyl-5-hydroxy-6-metoxy-1,4-benzoquinol methylase